MLNSSVFLTQIIVDPSGNSFVENPHAPRSDPHREVSHFLRSREQDHALGFYTEAEVNNTVNTEVASQQPEEQEKELASSTASTTSSTLLLRCQEGEVGDEASLEEGKAEYSGKGCKEATGIDCEVALPRVLSASTTSTALGTQTTSEKKQQPQQLDLTDEVLNFPTNCPECSSPADTKMKVTSESFFLISLFLGDLVGVFFCCIVRIMVAIKQKLRFLLISKAQSQHPNS